MEPNKNEVTTIELMKFIKRLSNAHWTLTREQVWKLERAEEIIQRRVNRAKAEFGL